MSNCRNKRKQPSTPHNLWAIDVPNDVNCACFDCCQRRNELDNEAVEACMDAIANAAFDTMEPSLVAYIHAMEANRDRPVSAIAHANKRAATMKDSSPPRPASHAIKKTLNLVAPPPKHSATRTKPASIHFWCHMSAAKPVGQFARGTQITQSVLEPMLFALTAISNKDQQLLDALKETSGKNEFVKASNVTPDAKLPPSAAILTNHPDTIQQRALNEMASLGVKIDSVATAIIWFLSVTVQQSLLEPLEKLGVYNLQDMSHLTVFKQHGRDLCSNPKASFLFIPYISRDRKLSTVNNANRAEFFRDPATGALKYYMDFWQDQLEIKNRKMEGTFSTLEIGMFIPEWSIPEEQLPAHRDALEWMKYNGRVLHGSSDILLLSLKQAYAHVFLHAARSDLVVKARMAGFQPVWLIKNCLLQKNSAYGINGYQFSSLDKPPKSYMSLVGFTTGKQEDGTFRLITLTNNKKEFLSLKN
jgi:hypothetical protein